MNGLTPIAGLEPGNRVNRPEVTAVIPTRNRPELVQRAVRSALSQTFQNLEVLVVIDGPDAATMAILSAMDDPRVRLLSLPESVGGAEARNVGVRAARGEWVALLDDDDEWLPRKIELQVARAVAGGNERTLVVSEYICRSTTAPDYIRPRRLPRPDEDIREYMFDFLCYFQTSTYFCSRSLLLEVPFQKTDGLQDIDWFFRVNSVPGLSLIVIPEALSVYYMPDDRASITSGLAWEKRLAWGRANRRLMTRRGYSRFIVGSCVGRAVEEGGGFRALWCLFREYALVGSPTVSGVCLLIGMCSVTPRLRRRVRNTFFLSRASAAAKTAATDGIVVRS
jgi:glycosyltransferase involved in cell wall biosynthesis